MITNQKAVNPHKITFQNGWRDFAEMEFECYVQLFQGLFFQKKCLVFSTEFEIPGNEYIQELVNLKDSIIVNNVTKVEIAPIEQIQYLFKKMHSVINGDQVLVISNAESEILPIEYSNIKRAIFDSKVENRTILKQYPNIAEFEFIHVPSKEYLQLILAKDVKITVLGHVLSDEVKNCIKKETTENEEVSNILQKCSNEGEFSECKVIESILTGKELIMPKKEEEVIEEEEINKVE